MDYYKIKDGSMLIYLAKEKDNCDHKRCTYNVIGLSLDDNTIYIRDKYQKESTNDLFKDKVIKSLEDFIHNKLLGLVDKELDIFIKNNTNNMNFYNVKGFYNLSMLHIGKDINLDIVKSTFDYANLDKGIIKIYNTDYILIFNFIGDVLEAYTKSHNSNKVTLLEAVYNQYIWCKLAYRQYKEDKAPDVYRELVAINDFMADKKSVCLVMKDNSKIRCKTKTDLILPQVLQAVYNSDTYTFKFTSNISSIAGNLSLKLDDLKYLQYNGKKLEINTDILTKEYKCKGEF